MAESSDEKEKRMLRELEGKNIAHYSTLLAAWIQTKMEIDKTLVTLSTAAIALLVTILTAVGTSNFYLFASSVFNSNFHVWFNSLVWQWKCR